MLRIRTSTDPYGKRGTGRKKTNDLYSLEALYELRMSDGSTGGLQDKTNTMDSSEHMLPLLDRIKRSSAEAVGLMAEV